MAAGGQNRLPDILLEDQLTYQLAAAGLSETGIFRLHRRRSGYVNPNIGWQGVIWHLFAGFASGLSPRRALGGT